MATVPRVDAQIHSALDSCASALRRIASYELEPSLQNRFLDLGERKELLSQPEYDELMALVDFTQKRTIESLDAKIALDRIGSQLREIVEGEIMVTDTKQILQSALALPDVDRAAIVESLLTSLDQPDAVIDESWAAEAEERLAEFDAGRMKAIPAADVFDEIDNL